MIARLCEAGDLTEDWRPSFERVPRHLFIPDKVWEDGTNGPTRLGRSEDPYAWLNLAYSDQPVITQLDDGDCSGRGYVSSSASMPSIVAMMLRRLNATHGMKVLEIGTGTGWNAGLLSARLGARNVVSVEVDAELAERARKALADAGHQPQVITADGMDGWLPSAPYDRVLATAAVQRVPYAWVAQARPGGLIVTPWGTSFHNGALACLTVDNHGTASGYFGGNVAFMWARSQRTPHGSVEDRVRLEHDYVETHTLLYPREPVSDFDASFAIGLRVPGMKSTVVFDGDRVGPNFTVYLMDPVSGAWASWRIDQGADTYIVRQHGPRRLFDELEAAYAWWRQAGRPTHDRFGLTVNESTQIVWLDSPDQMISWRV
ncbi:protein-L-isoaspartate(D-aspartate) O-methyltransferase [Nocardiopsis gilva YIM 90087]|uniref:Protein-L-isoaspartate O-methyltransferase n=1 Tax=Nocardiopsis gilva YIM 90087 TaxID=1235441 RepID=A0A223S1P5_9ACTN|nr:methyltransferase domain-containing protein [Nocardiopsis gilva]ASU82045.1 protein-L-isoaspartate(D-aspartate) O-methyltransferase [Nocardiopsis gilva YIM 90087]